MNTKQGKKALVIATNLFYCHNNDEYDSFRNEGRIPINIGFGLSLLGYEVNIVYHGWNINNYKTTWNNIKLSKNPIYDEYDIVLSFGMFNPESNLKFKKGLSIIYDKGHIDRTLNFIKETGIDLKCIITCKKLVNPLKKIVKREVYYLPILYPIPSISPEFPQPSYNPKLPELKMFLIYSSWPQNTTISGNMFLGKEQTIISVLRGKGYKLDITILVNSIEEKNQCLLDHDNIKYIYSNEQSYRQILNTIQNSDICVTHGSPRFPGNSLTEIVTLGKPLIYIGDGVIGYGITPEENVNLLYKNPKYIIYKQENYHESVKKIDMIMSNPVEIAEMYMEMHKDNNFNNWKQIITKVLTD